MATATSIRRLAAAATLLVAAGSVASAATMPAAPPSRSEPATRVAASGNGGGGGAKGFGELGSSKEPIAIDADRLDVFDKEGRAVFTGNVVAVQGDTTMRCTVMNVTYESKRGQKGQDDTAPNQTPGPGGLASESAIKKINCAGPVVIKTKTQTATGDRAEFDRVANKVFLLGNAALSDGPNVTRGERVAYDLSTGVANVEGGRVRALIVPGSDKDAAGGGKKGEAKAEPGKADPKKAEAKKTEAKKAESKKVDGKKPPEKEAKASPRP